MQLLWVKSIIKHKITWLSFLTRNQKKKESRVDLRKTTGQGDDQRSI
jgi:hypothetical protein